MKKFCFVQHCLDRTKENFENFWTVEADKEVFQELPFSLRKFTQFQQVHFHDIDSDTTLFVTMEDFKHEDYQIESLKKALKGKSFKKVFYDFSTYDNQDIAEEILDKFEGIVDTPSFFITKNLISTRKNHFWFEVLFRHYIENTPANDEAFKAFRLIRDVQTPFLRKHKGMYHVGHIRFHKIQLLEFLYQNKFLEDFLWGATGTDYDPGLFPELVPKKFQDEFRKFQIVNQLPHFYDYENYDHYNQRGNSFNFVTYLDTYFEVVAETKFYHFKNQSGALDTEKGWNNITEKVMRPTFIGHPFILLSKPNTIKTLESKGLTYRLDFWNHNYDIIEDDQERMRAIQSTISNILHLSKRELNDFYREYSFVTRHNYSRMYHELYSEQILQIYNEA